MKYIKGMNVKETPVMVDALDGSVELLDAQLRDLGYQPYDEVVYQQYDVLNGIEKSEEELKQEIMDSLVVEYPAGGLPFKLGYKWVPVVNNNKIMFESVKDPDAVGTGDNPILFAPYVKLVPNAYYFYEEARYVYVGLRTDNASSWDEVKDDMEEF